MLFVHIFLSLFLIFCLLLLIFPFRMKIIFNPEKEESNIQKQKLFYYCYDILCKCSLVFFVLYLMLCCIIHCSTVSLNSTAMVLVVAQVLYKTFLVTVLTNVIYDVQKREHENLLCMVIVEENFLSVHNTQYTNIHEYEWEEGVVII